MTPQSPTVSTGHQPQLLDQTVVVVGGSAGIGLETARHGRAHSVNVILTGRDPERLERAARDVGAQSTCWSPPAARITDHCSI